MGSELDKAIAIVDLGGQYCHLISRRLRDLKILSDIFEADVSPDQLKDYAGVILSGGPRSVSDEDSPTINKQLLDLGVPVLGICYGHQLLAQMLGGDVRAGASEFGRANLSLVKSDSLFSETAQNQTVWMSHSDSVQRLPDEVTVLATTDRCAAAAYAHFRKKLFGVQFHPEVVHTEYGSTLLGNFARRICGITQAIKDIDQVEHLVAQIQAKVKDDSVFFFVSGGVDSTVAFALCARALPKDRLLGVYVDTGLMRKGETDEFIEMLRSKGLEDRIKVRDARKKFTEALAGVIEPEKKRQIIGKMFVEVQREAMIAYGINEDKWLLGQGTIYPDTIESGGKNGTAAIIKTHHNRCEEVLRLMERGRVIEPLAEFYKDEVRKIGDSLGLSKHLTQRWPFPGPGLAIRCLCSDRPQDHVEELELPERFSAFQATTIPIRTVGVQGDARTYREAVALRGPVNYELIQEISTTLCNEGTVHNRIIFFVEGRDIRLNEASTKEAYVTEKRLSVLREADFLARQVMEEKGVLDSVWQFPVVLIPLSFRGGESIVLRPVNSEDGMTANFAKLHRAILQEIAARILKQIPEIDAVFLDVTDKPPATIEWE